MDNRLKKLIINFPIGWQDISDENPDGPPTFLKNNLEEPGVLQISTADYLSGDRPNPSYEDLVELSERIGLGNGFGEVRSKLKGDCALGKFGCVEFYRSDFPYIAVWHLSDGKNFVFSTFICSKQPTPVELSEVKAILTTIKRRKSFFGF